ncbi:MAG: amidophosphoribosyltransferase [Clostridiales bacterium]|nr:amidophosphoribosyltransferase [Clostridiales bacterium]
MDKLQEACGIIGISAGGENGGGLVSKLYMGLISIQHRGQEGAGIAFAKDGAVHCYKNKGLVSEVFNEQILSLISGEMYLGHVMYSGSQDKYAISAQPYVVNYKRGSLASAFNGALANAAELRDEMENGGTVFSTSSDCELAAVLVAKHDKGDIASAVQKVCGLLKGGYAMTFMTGKAMVGVRDPYGIRPLCIGTVDGRLALASESCAFDMMEGAFIRDVAPGEIVTLYNGEIRSVYAQKPKSGERAGCIFEYVYFANPDSILDGKSVYQCRERAGYILAQESPAEADIVIGAPDSGSPAALGFSLCSGIPYTIGLIKNKYVGRTFIQPTQTQREMSVRIKLNPIRPVLEGKRIVLVDDSIVRGTTMRYLIAAIRRAGALEVHLRISSPPVLHSCRFGVDTPDANDLIAKNMTTREVCESLGADSLAYISTEGMLKSLEVCGGENFGFCKGCFTGEYPNMDLQEYEQILL